jgi:hypothetical protein
MAAQATHCYNILHLASHWRVLDLPQLTVISTGDVAFLGCVLECTMPQMHCPQSFSGAHCAPGPATWQHTACHCVYMLRVWNMIHRATPSELHISTCPCLHASMPCCCANILQASAAAVISECTDWGQRVGHHHVIPGCHSVLLLSGPAQCCQCMLPPSLCKPPGPPPHAPSCCSVLQAWYLHRHTTPAARAGR